MSAIPYDPACVECRRVAGKDRAGTTRTCYEHLKTERDEARAALADCLADHDIAERDAAIERLRAERDAEAENCRLMQDRVTRVVEANGRLIALLRECREWIWGCWVHSRGEHLVVLDEHGVSKFEMLARIDEVLR